MIFNNRFKIAAKENDPRQDAYFQLKIQLQESWLDDVDGPKFLRGAEEEIQEDNEELDPINVSLLFHGKGGYESMGIIKTIINQRW